MKILIPLAIIGGLIAAIIVVQKFSNIGEKPPKERQETQQTTSREEMQSISEPSTNSITFTYKESDKVISTQDNPYISPSEYYQKDRITKDGVVIDAKDGVALLQDKPHSFNYIVTDTGKPIHKVATIEGYTLNPTIIYSDCEESLEYDPYSRLDGLYVGKTISYGIITEANPNRVTIKRNDGGKTIITFGRLRKAKKEATAEENPATPVEQIVEPPVVPNKVEGSSDPSTRG